MFADDNVVEGSEEGVRLFSCLQQVAPSLSFRVVELSKFEENFLTVFSVLPVCASQTVRAIGFTLVSAFSPVKMKFCQIHPDPFLDVLLIVLMQHTSAH